MLFSIKRRWMLKQPEKLASGQSLPERFVSGCSNLVWPAMSTFKAFDSDKQDSEKQHPEIKVTIGAKDEKVFAVRCDGNN